MRSDRQRPSAVIAAFAAAGGAALVFVGARGGAGDVAAALLIALGAIVPVRVPGGGSVPMGGAAIIAAVALGADWNAAAAVGAGAAAGTVLVCLRLARAEAVTAAMRLWGSCAGGVTAVLASEAAAGSMPTLAAAIAAGAGLTAADLATARWASSEGRHIDITAALPVHLTLACAGILVAVAVSEVGAAMAAVAAFPLLITHFSFGRYAAATDTLAQTVQALGLVPELAGFVPVGHSERSATYALALARALGFDRVETTRIITATRLHHLGAVPVGAGAQGARDDVAEEGARIVREAGIASDVADLIATARADAYGTTAPTLAAAVVRVAASFDDIVGEDPGAADRGLALVTGAARDPHTRRTAAALLELAAVDDGFVRDAVAAGDRFRAAAVGLDLDQLTTGRSGPGELLPFARRS